MIPSTILAIALATSSVHISIARELTSQGNHETSVSILRNVSPNKDRYNDYCFLLASNYFALNDKSNAGKWLKNLNDSFQPLQRRHEVMVGLMEEKLKSWKSGDMADISRDMTVVRDRLGNAKSGAKTQAVQKEIINKLDKLIKNEEDKAKAKSMAQGQGGNGTQQPGNPQGGKSGIPAADSRIVGGDNGKGVIDEKTLRKYGDNWGKLPATERAKVIQEITRDLPPKYKPMIEEYFKSLSRLKPEDKK